MDDLEDTPEQQTAIVIADSIERYAEGMWLYVSPKDLAESIRQRIRIPSYVNQGGTPNCAPAAVAYDLAAKKPALYAEIIRSLFLNGYAYLPSSAGFDGRLVTSDALRKIDYNQITGVSSKANRPEADWILLSALRNSESWANIYWGNGALGWISSTTLPSTFEGWLRGMGYTNIINETNLVVNKSVADLIDASSHFANKWHVFLFINSHVLQTSDQNKSSFVPNHYITLMSKVRLLDVATTRERTVNFVCATWGKSARVPENESQPVSEKLFCKHFYGYIAAKN